MTKNNNSILKKLVTPNIPRDHPHYMSEYMKIQRRLEKIYSEESYVIKQLEKEAEKLAENLFKALKL